MDPNKQFEDEMNGAFQKLATDIIPSDENIKNANVCTNKIVKLLQEKSKFKIGQVCIAGSTGKSTTIFSSDVDLVLFINDTNPPFKKVLEDFSEILTISDSFKIRDVRLTNFSVQFKANDLEFDLLPAANFAVNCQNGSGDHLSDEQHKKTLDYIKRDPKKFGYLYSGSLAKANVKFMKRQDGFTHEMVRLSKFWFKTLYFDEYVSGAKSAIELIAVYSAIKERKYGSMSYLRCFVQIMTHLEEFDKLNIVFENEYRFPEHQVSDKEQPRLIDPVNPYNNFAKNWSAKSIELIKCYAIETHCRIKFLSGRYLIHLNYIFEPQPMHLPLLSEVFPGRQWLISSLQYDLLPNLKIRNEFFENPRHRIGLELLKNYFQFMVHSVMASPNCSTAKVKEAIQSVIATHVINKKLNG